MLAKVAEAHDGSQQDGQGEGHGDEGDGGMEKQLTDDLERQAFAGEVIDIHPQKLHQQHKDHHEKGEDEASEK